MKKILIMTLIILLAKSAFATGNTLPTLTYGEDIEFGLDFTYRALNLEYEDNTVVFKGFYEGLHYTSRISTFQYQIYAGATQFTTSSLGFFIGLNPRYDFYDIFYDAGDKYILFFGSANLLYSNDSQENADVSLLEVKGEFGMLYGIKSLGLNLYSTINSQFLIYGKHASEDINFTESPFFGMLFGCKMTMNFNYHYIAFRLELYVIREYTVALSVSLILKQTYNIISQ